MRPVLALVTVPFLTAALVGTAAAKLPPLSDEAKAKAAEAAARTAWSDKVAAYKMCLAMDRSAEVYRTSSKSMGKDAPPPVPLPPCADPGPFVPVTPQESKPLEASGAHSPPGNAATPPSNKATSSEMTGTRK
ncbi:MAG TPA: hypothetical protein VHM00_02145 [Caldimonas sp.]|jgi:hypothetical protein|nr:hypothetical protein [Caldimonas sp.]HEX2539862.1 hypothetical protein [Caldimonas sp.]